MKPPCHSSLIALALAAGLAIAPPLLHADTSSPMFGGTSLDINGQEYFWDYAEENGDSHVDYYNGSGGTVAVSGLTTNTGLASVSGAVDGHLENGIYGDNYWESGTPGYGYWETTQYTVDLAQGELYWIHHTNDMDWTGYGTTSWEDSRSESGWSSTSYYDDYNGNISWSESWDSTLTGPGSRSGGSTQAMGPGSDAYLFGQTFVWSSENSTWEQGSDGTENGSGSTSYSSSDGSLTVSYTYDTPAGISETTVSGSDPYIGYFEGTISGVSGDLNAVVWDARTAPSFAPTQFWINGWLVSWQGGTLSSDGTVVDTYAGDLLGVTISGPARDFAQGNTTATVAVQGNTAGTVDWNGTWTLNGWTVSTSEPQQTSTTEPFFLPGAASLYVDGAEYPFEASYTGSGGARVDVYVNASLGTVRLSGQTAGTAHVAGNSGTTFFEGSLAAGVFSTTVPVTVVVSASPPPVVFEPAPLWVRGVYYGTRVLDVDQVPTNTFTNADGTASLTFTEGTNPGEWDVTGVDAEDQPVFSGTLTSLPAGVFMLTGAQGGGAFPAIVVGANGEFQGIGGTQAERNELVAASMPLAVSVNTIVYESIGLSADDAVPEQEAAWYVRRGAADATRLLKIAQGGSGVAAVTLTDYSAATPTVSSGTYDPASYLFQTGTTASLPKPLYSAAANESHTRVLLPLADGTLPASFVVRGQSWWYAGTDGSGNALYQGFYNGQGMSLGAPDADGQRLVTLTDPLHNDGTATSGTLSSERKSVRLRDGTLVLSGDEQGNTLVVTHQDDYQLHTLAADLDIVGNNLSFGILQGDASLAGALFQFADDGATATLHSILSRPQTQWGWWKAEGVDGDTLRPVMWLGSDHKLSLYQAGSYDAPAIVLDPAGTSSFQGPVRVPQSGDIPMGIYQEGDPP